MSDVGRRRNRGERGNEMKTPTEEARGGAGDRVCEREKLYSAVNVHSRHLFYARHVFIYQLLIVVNSAVNMCKADICFAIATYEYNSHAVSGAFVCNENAIH